MVGKMLSFGMGMLVLLFALHPAKADSMPTEKFSYAVDFEAKDPVQFWTGSKSYTVNFKGLTDEKSTEGKKCFKLDVTLGASELSYWCIRMPRRVPAEGSLKFTGHVYLDEASTGNAVLMPSYQYPPSTVSDFAISLPYKSKDKGKWLFVQGDLVDIGKIPDLSYWGWGEPSVSDTARYLDNVAIRINGQKGDRVVIYLDDFKIEGDVPVAAEYAKEAVKRWAPIKERVEKQVARWSALLEKNTKDIEGINACTESAIQAKKEALAKIPGLRRRIKNIADRDNMAVKEYRQIDNDVRAVEECKQSLLLQVSLAGAGDARLVVTTPSPISSIPVLPTGFRGISGDKIAVTAAQGEYEPASFVVHSMKGTKALTVKVEDLKQGNKIIPASSIDVKVVKCWYQSGTAWYDIHQDKSERVLVPELLLNDDSLVKVDTEKKENYLKLSFPEGGKYVWISNPNETAASVEASKSLKDFPVKDSPVLLPVDIPANENKQFWITVKVPEDAAPGTYTGKIRLASADGDKSELTLSLNVLPFTLPKPYYDSAIYYYGRLFPPGIGSLYAGVKSRVQLAAELKNMADHGIDKPLLWQKSDRKDLMEEHLDMRRAAGIVNDPLYYQGIETSGNINTIREFVNFAAESGIKEVYFYGKDEAKGDDLVAQRPEWTELRKAGGKVFVAGYKENYPKMGDIQDLLVSPNTPSKVEADKWHSIHRKIWCYANPQSGVENPEVYRRNFGLVIWQNNYDGACTFAYSCGFGNTWNDFDDPKYRDHNFVYPTVDGVIDTIAWEGYREGVDDIRYLTALIKAVDRAKTSKDGNKVKAAQEAEKYLVELKTTDLAARDLSKVRSEIVRHIMEVNK